MTDEAILSQLRDSNQQNAGFRALMTKYQERLYWHIRRIVLTHEDTDDVIQDVFVKVFRHVSSFEGKSSLFTWLYRIATNEALSHIARAKKHTHGDISEFVENKLLTDPYFEGDSVQLKLKTAISNLPEKQMLVFNMKYYQEMKYTEMSEILDTSVGALKASYHHAVKKIQQEVTESNIYHE